MIIVNPFSLFNLLKGESGIDINHAWAKKIETYRSMFIPGFPNFFLMLGPNSPIGNTSLIQLSEVQTDYIIKMIEHWKAGAVDEIKPRVSAVKAFQHAIKQSMSNTVWVGGCKSWYLDGSGTPALWPWTMERWYKEMKTPNLVDFVLPNNMAANEEYGNYIGSLQKEAALAEELEIAV